MKKNLSFAAIIVAVVLGYFTQQHAATPQHTATASQPARSQIEQAFRQQRSNIQVQGRASVIKVLPDDLKGSRHQRFLIRLASGQTLLVAHNIDLAPRVPGLHKGSKIDFNGEYEWNKKGGVLHWTHHDPGHRHADGWLRYNGKTYQ